MHLQYTLPGFKRCGRCHILKATSDFPTSPRNKDGLYGYCRECHSANVRAYHKTHRAETAARVKRWMADHPERQRAIHNASNARLRAHVLAAYGHRCACCGITEAEFLAFDHIAGDGAAHRAETKLMGSRLYNWIKREGYPKDRLQLLCHSCNKSKAFYGYCPHQGRPPESPLSYGQQRTRRLRAQVIAGYGSACACCQETIPEFLAVDHIHNDGKAERQRGLFGTKFYQYLIAAGFPTERHRLLCHCCNEGRAFYGVCPHETARLACA